VRDRLEAIGFDLDKYTNRLAAVHTVLKRLNQSQEVLFVELANRRRTLAEELATRSDLRTAAFCVSV